MFAAGGKPLFRISRWFNGTDDSNLLYDRTLVWLIIGLATAGFIIVSSASISLSKDPFAYAKKDAVFLIVATVISLVVLQIPMKKWQQFSPLILLGTIILLILVLVIGDPVKGASRWIQLPFMNIQPAEMAKLSMFIYLASYLVRKVDEVRNNFWGFCKPMGVMLTLAILLLAQPDLGTVVVLFITTLGLLFLAGAKLWQFLAIIGTGIFSVALLIITEPYRLRRVTSFWDPWADPYGSGYQLSQSLIAFGRGGIFGEGLGNSIQKQKFLPEPHTDFIFAITSEELGYLGAVLVLLMVFFIAFRAMSIGHRALKLDLRFSGFLACAIGLWFAFQTLVNVGAASGILPTKGLTFPFLSYGGSSLIVMSVAAMLLLRIDFESRLATAQAHSRSSK